MPFGAFTHETVFDTIEESGNISSPIAANPRRRAVAAISWRRKRCASPSSRISCTATRIAWVRCVGMETGWRRGPPSGTLPPRDTGIHHSFQRRRSYAQLRAGVRRRSIACHARGLTPTSARPSGAARHFCEPVMLRSTPHSSVRTSSPAIEDTGASRKSAPTAGAIVPTSAAGYVVPVEVSLCTSVIALGRRRSASRRRRSRSRRAPHSTGNSVQSAPTRVMISRMSRPNCPAPTTSTRSPGSITESAPASRAVRPEPGIRRTSPRVWNTSRSASVVGSRTASSNERSYWMAAGWLRAWTTGQGSSVGPGIISTGRVWHWAQLIVTDTAVSFVAPILHRPSPVGDALGLAEDEVEVARVDEEPRALADDEDRVQPVDRVGEQRDPAADRKVPERVGHHALLGALRGDPLHEEAAGEERLPEQADAEPNLIRCHRGNPHTARTCVEPVGGGAAGHRPSGTTRPDRTSRAGRCTPSGYPPAGAVPRRARRSSRPPPWGSAGACRQRP